jgi:hypothetical protein
MGWIGRVRGEYCTDILIANQYIELTRPLKLNALSNRLQRVLGAGAQNCAQITNFVFSLLAIFVKLRHYINICT